MRHFTTKLIAAAALALAVLAAIIAGATIPATQAQVIYPPNALLQPGDITTTLIANGAITPIKIATDPTWNFVFPGTLTASSTFVASSSATIVGNLTVDGTCTGCSTVSPPGFGIGADGASTTKGTTVLNRDYFFTSLTVPAGAKVETNGYEIYANVSITNQGTIENNGQDGATSTTATGAAGGKGGAGGTLAAGPNGGNGANGSSSGGGTGQAGTSENPSLGVNGVAGGSPSAGGTGGAAGTATAENPQLITSSTTIRWTGTTLTGGIIPMIFQGQTSLSSTSPSAGSGGGGGGGVAGNSGGGGGGGGGTGGNIVLAAPTITNSGTIQANGGNGGGSVTGLWNDGGGGGGGSGGIVVLIYDTLTNTGTIREAGGEGGSNVGPGLTAPSGNAGKTYYVQTTNAIK